MADCIDEGGLIREGGYFFVGLNFEQKRAVSIVFLVVWSGKLLFGGKWEHVVENDVTNF